MTESKVHSLGDLLYAALRGQRTISPLTDTDAELTVEDAYRISLRLLERRLQDGEKVIGKKIGVTSRAVQEMLNVRQPDFGFLTDAMQYPDGAEVSITKAGLIQPRAEGEIAFLLGRDLGSEGVTAEEVLDATEAVMPCFEIVDSRIDNWRIRIQDTVADNASCGIFVVGNALVDPRSIDLANAELKMFRNGKLEASGFGSAVQGHPAEAVAWLANTLGKFGIPFRKGEIILSGSLVPLVPAAAGDRFELTIDGIGSSSISFVA
ncbi:fumarylacetoacetate hydrolase family protein [Noviherbaspirillum denitrificans]|uniref:2-oxopent-4-enoate hydratase n=1 Tax=Noviherbaspirillum denitrificans TaxID=1968433 RepID=A0A254TGC3_9BURK|nr:fumarylacetoacetate hydrolase family protein [Noviherbaspirillum denitrificans]OWW21217.1 2-oxopent-4-enoate hydratase [Noviherbaspirillum denitrificans]